MPMKTRGWLIIGAIILAGTLALAFTASQGPAQRKTVAKSTTITVTVLNNIGVSQIEITNLNTGKTFQFSLISLPTQFNCTRGDYLEIKVTTNPGYRWNAWWFSPMDTWNNDNPAIICADGNVVLNNEVVMIPNCLILPPTPTPRPIPTPSPFVE